MKHFIIKVTTPSGVIEFSGIFQSAIDATLAGMDRLSDSDPSGRVQVRLK